MRREFMTLRAGGLLDGGNRFLFESHGFVVFAHQNIEIAKSFQRFGGAGSRCAQALGLSPESMAAASVMASRN